MHEPSASDGTLGSTKSAFEPSFGYLSRSAGVYTDSIASDGSNLPSSALDLAVRNFLRELPEMRKALTGKVESFCGPAGRCSDEAAALRSKLDALVLDNDAVWKREKEREKAGGGVSAPLVLLGPYYFLCFCLDVCFEKRPLARFWFLETVARMPYFACAYTGFQLAPLEVSDHFREGRTYESRSGSSASKGSPLLSMTRRSRTRSPSP